MNKNLLYVQADLHRAINSGQRSLSISVLDLKELLGAVESSATREQNEKCGVIFGFVRKETLSEMRCGKTLHLTVRRKKDKKGEYCVPVYCDPNAKPEVDATAQVSNDTPLQSAD